MFIHQGNRPCPFAVAGPLVFVCVCLTFAACGGPGYELAPVSGRVTINGTPTEGVQLNFQPRSGGSARSQRRPRLLRGHGRKGPL